MDVSGKVILVTGGSRGLGKAIVHKLAQQGAKVAFTYRSNEVAAQALLTMLKEEGIGNNVLAIQADVSKSDNAEYTISTVVAHFGSIDGLVNNAGITKDGALYKMSDDNWKSVIDTNLNGVFYLTKAYLNRAVRNKEGKIVNMSSVSGIKGLRGQGNYCASKGGLIALTKSIAVEYAKFNIQVNAIAPGYIATEMVESLTTPVKDRLTKTIPLKRLGCPKDIANITTFLLSDACNYLTGQTIVIDGGLSA